MALDISQRRKRAQIMRRNSAKLAAGRRRAEGKTPSMEKMKSRATKRARTMLFNKFAKGKDKAEMSASEINMIEDKINKAKSAVDRLSKKILAQMKQER